jgi:beta-lactam-binding protein with PASTA domain
VGYASNKKVLKGRVVAQWFVPGSRFPHNTQVPIIVSKGPH